jgi:hypothetical protein
MSSENLTFLSLSDVEGILFGKEKKKMEDEVNGMRKEVRNALVKT